jgi:lipoprotein-releasing system permease protein
MNKLELLIAWRYLGAQRKSLFVSLISLFSMMGVCIGTFALVVALSAINGFEDEVTNQMIGKDAHFEMLLYHNDPMYGYDSIVNIVLADPDVIAATPYIIYKVGISSKKVNDGIVVYGIDPEKSKTVIDLSEKVKYGHYSLDSLADSTGVKKDAILLGSVLANRLKVLLGDKIILQTFQSTESGAMSGPAMSQFLVAGIFETGMYEYDANLAYISIPSAQKLLGMGRAVSGIQAKVKDPWIAEAAALRIQKYFGYPFYTVDWKTKNRTLLKWMNYEKYIVGVVITLIILVAAFNIISSLIMVVIDKTREIGILRSMGISSSAIMRIFILVGSFIGVVGTFIGGSVGLLLCMAQLKWGFITLPADVYMISVFPVRIMWADVFTVFGIGNILCVVATLLPAYKASRLDPVGAIRHE